MVVGYCTPNHDDLTVLPEARRRGHGRRLWRPPRASCASATRTCSSCTCHRTCRRRWRSPGSIGMVHRSSLWQFQLPPDGRRDRSRLRPSRRTSSCAPGTTPAIPTTTRGPRSCSRAFEGHPDPDALDAGAHPPRPRRPRTSTRAGSCSSPMPRPRTSSWRSAGLRSRDPATHPTGERTGDVGLIGVLPAWRRRGLGPRAAALGRDARCGTRGVGLIELSVEAANDRATALYRAHGFVPAIEWPHWVLPVS